MTFTRSPAVHDRRPPAVGSHTRREQHDVMGDDPRSVLCYADGIQRERTLLMKAPQNVMATGYLAIPKRGAGPGVLVLHAWWGLTPFFKRVCDRLADEGFVAFAPDLNNGKTAWTIDEAKQITSERDFEATRATALAALDQLRGHPAVRGSAIGAIGFSMGAAWALLLSSLKPDAIAAVVVFYGSEAADFGARRLPRSLRRGRRMGTARRGSPDGGRHARRWLQATTPFKSASCPPARRLQRCTSARTTGWVTRTKR